VCVAARLFHDDIHNLLGHYDYLHHLLAVDILLAQLVGEHCLLYGVVGGIGGKLLLEAGLAVEGDGELHLALYQVLLVAYGPLGVAYAALHVESAPQFFGDMGRKGSDEHGQDGEQLAVVALLLSQLVDANHKGRDGSVV